MNFYVIGTMVVSWQVEGHVGWVADCLRCDEHMYAGKLDSRIAARVAEHSRTHQTKDKYERDLNSIASLGRPSNG